MYFLRQHRAHLVALALTGVLFSGTPNFALAKTPPRTSRAHICNSAYESAQTLEASAHLLGARSAFKACAATSCGDFLSKVCTARFARLESDIPTIIPLAIDERGAPIEGASVAVDGKEIDRVDGRAVVVDPGPHELRFSAGGESATARILVVQGQRNRTVEVRIAVARNQSGEPDLTAHVTARASGDRLAVIAAREPPSSGPSVFTYALGATGVVGLSAGGLLYYWARKDNDALGSCAPRCKTESVAHVRTMYAGADIALGAGIAALAGSVVLYLTSSDPDRGPSVELGVAPNSSGATASLSGVF